MGPEPKVRTNGLGLRMSGCRTETRREGPGGDRWSIGLLGEEDPHRREGPGGDRWSMGLLGEEDPHLLDNITARPPQPWTLVAYSSPSRASLIQQLPAAATAAPAGPLATTR